MQCYSHSGAHAIGVCKGCGRGVCRACATETARDIVCSIECAEAVNAQRKRLSAWRFRPGSADLTRQMPAGVLVPGLSAILLMCFALSGFLITGNASAPLAAAIAAALFAAACIINWRRKRRLDMPC